jgi:phenylalanyl-tRNA synthetase alpha chain
MTTGAQIDRFQHPKTQRESLCYRINYQSMDRSLANDEINALQEAVTAAVVDQLGVEIR